MGKFSQQINQLGLSQQACQLPVNRSQLDWGNLTVLKGFKFCGLVNFFYHAQRVDFDPPLGGQQSTKIPGKNFLWDPLFFNRSYRSRSGGSTNLLGRSAEVGRGRHTRMGGGS